MDAGVILRAGSLRTGSSSVWREDQVFSRSIHKEDDEEALIWATLEKLGTYDRMKKGLLRMADGGGKEIDIQNLEFQERKELLERLVRDAEEDNEKFLLKFRERIDRVGIEIPTIEVRYEQLNVTAEVYVGNRGLPTMLNFVTNALESLPTNFTFYQAGKSHCPFFIMLVAS